MTVSTVLSKKLGECGTPVLAPKGALIFDQPEYAEGAYLVLEGRVYLSLSDSRGVPLWSRVVGPGTILGLPAAIANQPRCLRAVAIEPTQMRFVPGEQISKLIRDDAAFAADVLHLLSEEISDARRKLLRLRSAG